jgi:hypothetical protein
VPCTPERAQRAEAALALLADAPSDMATGQRSAATNRPGLGQCASRFWRASAAPPRPNRGRRRRSLVSPRAPALCATRARA